MKINKLILLFFCGLLLNSCGAYFNQPITQHKARQGEFSKSTQDLLDLPEAQTPVEVAVYNFRDQTGQYKSVENGSTFSTAVTQGSTAILLKALEDSNWFIPIERENLSNLTTERNIIRNTKQEYIKNLNPNEPPLPPLKYAGIILEGGIVSYDTNIVTGGLGARYFGIGGSTKYRQDRITVYLRMVSTSNGEILKTVYVSKTILSQALDASFFRFVKFQRLLEAETGITQNEPVQLAVKDAVEKAVKALIIEGIADGYWSAKGGNQVNQELVESYVKEKKEEQSIRLYDRLFKQNDKPNYFSIMSGVSLIDGDYSQKKPGFYLRTDFGHSLNNNFDLEVAASLFQANNDYQYKNEYLSIDLNTHFNLLPNDNFGPFIYAGPGFIFDHRTEESEAEDLPTSFMKLQYGLGLRYSVNQSLDLKFIAEQNIALNDLLDGVENGKRNDFYYNFGLGIQYRFGTKQKNKLKTVTDEN